jgi:hypothetical protein
MTFATKGNLRCRSSRTASIAAALIFASLLLTKPTVANESVCSATADQPTCDCDLTKLRLLQAAVGMKEVE